MNFLGHNQKGTPPFPDKIFFTFGQMFWSFRPKNLQRTRQHCVKVLSWQWFSFVNETPILINYCVCTLLLDQAQGKKKTRTIIVLVERKRRLSWKQMKQKKTLERKIVCGSISVCAIRRIKGFSSIVNWIPVVTAQ